MITSTLKRDILAIFCAVAVVSSITFAEDSNITNTTTTTSTVTSNNTNTNNNTNVNQSTSTNTNTNFNTNNTTISQTNNSTSNNTNVNTSTVTSTINQTQNVNNTSVITNNSTSENTNLNTNNSTSVSTNTNNNNNVSSSTSEVTTNNQNVNTNNNTSQNVNTNNSTSVSSQRVTQTVKSPPPSAIAPSIMSYSQDLCTTGASAAVQTQIFGVSAGKSVRDENCERLKNSKALYDMGMKVAAVALLCQDEKVFRAMEQSGSPCPYKGKIGVEAQKAWDENPEDRPDWHLIKADMKGYEFRAYKKKDFCKKYPTQKICLKP